MGTAEGGRAIKISRNRSAVRIASSRGAIQSTVER